MNKAAAWCAALPLGPPLKKKGTWCIRSSPREAHAASMRLTRKLRDGGGSGGRRPAEANISKGKSSVEE